MNRSTLQPILAAAQARLTADRERILAETGLPSGLAYLALPLLDALQAHDDQDEVGDLLKDLVGTTHRRALRQVLAGDVAAALRALDPEGAVGQACRALLEAVTAPERRPALDVQMRIEASDGSRAEQIRQVVVQPGGSYHEAPHDPAQVQQQQALIDYLRALQHACSALQLGQIDAHEGRHQHPMRLEQIYIGLHTERQVAVSPDTAEAHRAAPARHSGATRPLTALEALNEPHPARLMLLGPPGSGKSTFVNHLVLCLAGVTLCARVADEPQPEVGWLERLPDWSVGVLVPLRIILRDLAAFPALARARMGTLELLHAFMKTVLGVHAAALVPLTQALTEGRAILLFDGLDEVVGDAVLARVTECITAAAGTYRRSPVLVTCRVLDYQANTQRHLTGFRVETLAPLHNTQIDAFITAWYAERVATGRQMLGSAEGLRRALNEQPELRELARQPLLLTMIAIVHSGKGTLPESRALLYMACIELLLLRWRQEPDQPDVLQQLALPQFQTPDLLRLMAHIGFTAHEQAARDPDQAERPADLNREQVRTLLEQGFAPYTRDPVRRDHLVSLVLHRIATRNGLLLKRSGEDGEAYTFPHRSFQEFLAGYYLSVQGDYDRRCLERTPQIHWHEALRLMVSFQVLGQNLPGPPLLLARELLDRSPVEQALAGEILNLVGRARTAGYRPDLVRPGGLWDGMCDRVLAVVTRGTPPDAPAAVRVRAGLALGLLCYGDLADLSHPQANVAAPDPRLPLAVLQMPAQQEPWWPTALEAYWCAVAAGPCWYGDDTTEEEEADEPDDPAEPPTEDNPPTSPLQQVTLPYDFRIARFPVTNAEFARFVADGGYTEQRWWTEEGWKQRTEDNWTEPGWWDAAQFTNPAQPVVGVSWYEAVAYCAWLTDQGHTQGWLPTTDEIRLPTSLEWERAARHTDQRRYPWGDAEPDAERANYQETGIGAPSPVGCFPQGRARCGALDMAGNVDEWTGTPDDKDQQVEAQKDFTSGDVIIVLGGVWSAGKEYLFCGSRDWNGPSDWNDSLGFRVVQSPRSST